MAKPFEPDIAVSDQESAQTPLPLPSIATYVPATPNPEGSTDHPVAHPASSEVGLTNLVPPLVPPVLTDEKPLPTEVGRFRVLELIARGGMGMVLRGFDPLLGRELAIKVMRPGKN